MKTDADFEKRVRSSLRDALDREWGPDPTWADSSAARRVAELEHRARRRWPLRLLAVAALIGVIGGAGLLGGALDDRPDVSHLPANGWIAFAMSSPVDDVDIWFVALGQKARRVIGSDTDSVQQLCPAFSPDGRSLAYGRVEGHGTEYFMDADGVEGSRPSALTGAALGVADVSADGRVSDRLTIDVGEGLPPPCPVWSPDGLRVAFGVNLTSPINPTTSAAGSEVRIVTLADGKTTVLPDLLATDLEWSPDSSLLAIASGIADPEPGGRLQDGRINLYSPSSGAMRVLDDTLGATDLAWSPDERFLAYATGDSRHELRLIDVVTERQRVLAAEYGAIHGIGPVWSPDGETIAFQRQVGCCESHEVVLVTPGDLSDESAVPGEVVMPQPEVAIRGSDYFLLPYRVTWSPDGKYLLYVAWGVTQSRTDSVDPLIAAVPLDPDLPSVLLVVTRDIVSHDGYPDTTTVPIQIWGRQPSD